MIKQKKKNKKKKKLKMKLKNLKNKCQNYKIMKQKV